MALIFSQNLSKNQFSLTQFKCLYQFSLYQSGKSRADLWQFAGLVALERLIERSNRACDLDYHQRQQVRLLEGREKCEIKLTKPLKFMTGRKDCITDRKRTYKTGKKEVFLKQVLRILELNDCKRSTIVR